jgi:hypothetical protein
MQVYGWSTDDEKDWTAPFPAGWEGGVKLRLLGGDILDPVRGTFELRPGVPPGTEPGWFNAVPRAVYRAFQARRCLPFFSFGFFRFGGYIGWKVYGVDQPAYLDYPLVAREDVYPGSRALCLTMRLTTDRPRRIK